MTQFRHFKTIYDDYVFTNFDSALLELSVLWSSSPNSAPIPRKSAQGRNGQIGHISAPCATIENLIELPRCRQKSGNIT